MQDHTLKALVVFRNFIYPELIRSVHVYQLEGDKEKVVEREYVFHSRGDYEEIGSSRVITLEKFRVSAQFKGLVNGVWLCIYVFDADRPLPPCQDDIPTLLLLRSGPEPGTEKTWDTIQHIFVNREKAINLFRETRSGSMHNQIESIRSVHVYPLENGKEKVVAREYVFHSHDYYEEIGSSIFILEKFRVSSLFKGFVSGVWLCIYVFDVDCPRPPNLDEVPEILLVSRDSKLFSIPTLANDLIMISQLTNKVEDGEKWQIVVKETDSLDNAGELPSTSQQTLALDLNSFPPELDNEEWDGQSGAGKKKRRAGPRAMAGMDLADLAKYFDLPIAEAAKNLKVGVTVLKKRCRELGIPRWPHRKIKSLDSLIHDLQNEVAQQQETDEATAMMVAQRQMMLENEKHNIERKPFMEIQVETKRFRQDIFKKRHRAKARELLQY